MLPFEKCTEFPWSVVIIYIQYSPFVDRCSNTAPFPQALNTAEDISAKEIGDGF